METKNLKYLILPSVFFVAIGAYLFYSDDELAQTQKDRHLEQNALMVKADAIPQNTESPKPSKLTEEEINQLNFDIQAELKQKHYLAEKYRHERGLISPDERRVYQNYSLDTLQEMGKSGDIHALHELGQRASNDGNFELAFAYYESAAVYGSTVALGYLGDKYEMANKLYLDDKNGKHALLIATSYLRVAELRGDYSNSYEITRLPEKYERTYGKIELDENDYREIEKIAKEIYTKMESKRIELGLGPFDNSIPEGSTAQLHKEMALKERAKNN